MFTACSRMFEWIWKWVPHHRCRYRTNQWPSMLLTGPPFHCRRRTRLSHSILLLLIIGGVEVNPGPLSSINLNFGLLNTRSVVNKASLLHCLITDNDLSFLALTETWVKTDDPPVIKNDLHHPVTVSLMFIETTPTKPEVVALRLSTGMK